MFLAVPQVGNINVTVTTRIFTRDKIICAAKFVSVEASLPSHRLKLQPLI
jgi:hypothetical protein